MNHEEFGPMMDPPGMGPLGIVTGFTERVTDGRHPDFDKVVDAFELLLEGLGIPETEHTKHTAVRAARAWWGELCRGLTEPPPQITAFASEVDSLVISCGIPVFSVCEHHLLPFLGEAAVGYIPGNGQIVGISKLSRIVDHWARRPQVQEELTAQIADAVERCVMAEGKGGVAVVIRAKHMCMELRGVKHKSAMVTSALRGVFREDAAVRAEFFKLAGEDHS